MARQNTEWKRGPMGDFYGFKYRTNRACPFLIDEVIWDKDVVFKARPPIEVTYQPSNRFPNAVKQAIWDKTNGHCYYCGDPLKPWETFSVDHVIPRSKGGTDAIENLVPSCRICNSRKGARL